MAKLLSARGNGHLGIGICPIIMESEKVLQRTSSLLQNTALSDVTFIVGPPSASKKYVGHRVLLAMTSPVFEAMFYGDMADKSKVIRITDIAPIGFENLLR
ncbi:hypothetical protein AVEN_271418-1 [Araneus ventricosus]|uniref:BTB domain-containing protein n=1 Tax=Araneus ventricosus TaxID=182803 RepID=A0A4Y2H7C6_ARAVE|nr:hypothetical protein AVEN_271418-1 [Araneus ventricosus]